MTRPGGAGESLEALQKRIGYRFRESAWLQQALTHRSHREGGAATRDNERLEFLGDAIVGFIVSDAVCRLFPELSEGKLSRIKANLVSARSLRHAAERLELGRYLRLGAGEEKTGGRQKPALLADAFEALVAALYRDGGLEPARQFVEEFLLPEIRAGSPEPFARADHKSALQEYLQARQWPPARYQTVETRGPEHRKSFTVEVWVGGRCLARGEGNSKKAAEQQAARQALEHLPAEVGAHSE